MTQVQKVTDKRIEELLNKYDQTMSDLPKQYTTDQKSAAIRTACECYMDQSGYEAMGSYICRLADIIDRMDWALTNAGAKDNAAEKEQPGGMDMSRMVMTYDPDTGNILKAEDLTPFELTAINAYVLDIANSHPERYEINVISKAAEAEEE